jgi:hypothetical protein
MDLPASRFQEMIVRLLPSRDNEAEQKALVHRADEEVRFGAYDALVYTHLGLPAGVRTRNVVTGQPDTMGALPLRAVEKVYVHWDRYETFVADFAAGEKAPLPMRERLSETISSGLKQILDHACSMPQSGPVRLWWDIQCPELMELPWELLATPGLNPTPPFFLVRGLPAASPPPLQPLQGSLRLGVIGTSSIFQDTRSWFQNLPGLQVEFLSGPPRRALHEAKKRGIELLHLYCDGVATEAYEGVLYFHDNERTFLTTQELSAFLQSSRVTMIGLTAARFSNPDVIEIASRLVPSVYRAFALFASDFDVPLPNIVAPLGPWNDDRIEAFWRELYASLAVTHSLEEAVWKALSGQPPLPVATFLRHPQGRLFARSRSAVPISAPTQMQTDLRVSGELVNILNAHAQRYGTLPENTQKILDQQKTKHLELDAGLERWRSGEAFEE